MFWLVVTCCVICLWRSPSSPFPGGKPRPDKTDKDKRPRNGECWGWEGLFYLCGDVDQQLPSLLREGVPTGILRPIPPSGVWRETDVPERPNLELHTFDTPCGSAQENICELVEEDVKAGFAS